MSDLLPQTQTTCTVIVTCDLTLCLQPYQDCQDVVKEVPYLAPEEQCKDVSNSCLLHCSYVRHGECGATGAPVPGGPPLVVSPIVRTNQTKASGTICGKAERVAR